MSGGEGDRERERNRNRKRVSGREGDRERERNRDREQENETDPAVRDRQRVRRVLRKINLNFNNSPLQVENTRPLRRKYKESYRAALSSGRRVLARSLFSPNDLVRVCAVRRLVSI